MLKKPRHKNLNMSFFIGAIQGLLLVVLVGVARVCFMGPNLGPLRLYPWVQGPSFLIL